MFHGSRGESFLAVSKGPQRRRKASGLRKRPRSDATRKRSGEVPSGESASAEVRGQGKASSGAVVSSRAEVRDESLAIESEVPDDPDAVGDAADRVREILTEAVADSEDGPPGGSPHDELPHDDTDLNRYVATQSDLARRKSETDGEAEADVSTMERGKEGRGRGRSSASRATRGGSGSGQRPGAKRGRRSSAERSEARDPGARRASGERRSSRGSGERRSHDSGERRGSSARKSAAAPARQKTSPAMYAALFGVPVILLILIFFVVSGKPPVEVRDEKRIEDSAKRYYDEGVQAFREMQRAKQVEDAVARSRFFNLSQEKLDKAMEHYENLFRAHSSEAEEGLREAHKGYEYIEERIQQIQEYRHDLAKDSYIGD